MTSHRPDPAAKSADSGPSPHRAAQSRRRDAARHLLKPHQVRESLALVPQPWLRNAALAGLQASLSAAVALPLALNSPWPHLVGYAALGVLAALFGRFAPPAGRGRVVALCGMWITLAVLLMSAVAAFGLPFPAQLAVLALACGVFFFIATTGQYGPPGALIFVFAAGAAMGHGGSAAEVLERAAATALAAALTWAICAVTEPLRQQARPDAPFPVEPLRPLDHRLIAATRIALGAGIAAFAAYAAGAAHPVWASLGAMAVMQGSHLHISMSRALQRMAGTVVGAALVWLILVQEPSIPLVVALLVGLQFATELVIGANYALGQILVTPMALLTSYLAAPGAHGAAMAPERVFDTMVGAAIGIALAVAFSSVDDRAYLAHHHAERERRSGP